VNTASPLPTVAFLTLDDRSAYVIDDDLAIAELRARGLARRGDPPGADAGVDWGAFDLVVIRTTWDYQHDLDAFFDEPRRHRGRGRPRSPTRAPSSAGTPARPTSATSPTRGVPIVPTRWGHDLSAEGLTARSAPPRATAAACSSRR
jgi:hypothetical protein